MASGKHCQDCSEQCANHYFVLAGLVDEPLNGIFSPETLSALKDVILNTLLFDSARAGHTTETLIDALRRMRLFSNFDWYENAVRIFIGQLLAKGAIDMRADGLLLLPPEAVEKTTELYHGFWYSVITGQRIGGPFKTQQEAVNDLHGHKLQLQAQQQNV